jgi:7,8-dihydroneopterin aldolase/epimerase/oxygenase
VLTTSQPMTEGLAQAGVAVSERQRGDRISIAGVTARGFHGVFDEERANGQEFVVDVILHVNLEAAATSDQLADTVDYGGLASQVVADIEGDPLNLIEALAERIAQTCLRFERVTSAEVTVHKPQAPMPVRVSDVAVTVVRTRRPGGVEADHARDGDTR